MLRARSPLLSSVVICVGLCAVAVGRTPQDPPQTPPQSQLPIFRGGTNLVLVDAYPRTKDGHIIEGLQPSDFEVYEDGKLQTVEQFEFVRVEPVPESERRDPNTDAEMRGLAADPHNRVFVVVLDTYHVTQAGSKAMRFPLITMLDRVLGPGDLFGMTTPKFSAATLVLGRKLVSVEQQLAREWPWGEFDAMGNSEEENFFAGCFGFDPKSGGAWGAADGSRTRSMQQILVDRWREDRTLQHLTELVTHMGEMREARTIVMVVTGGWRLFRQDQTLAAQGGKRPAGPPAIGVPPGGGPIGILSRDGNGQPTSNKCNSELLRLAYLDDDRVFVDLINLANRNNVVFYTISPDGLAASDARPWEISPGNTGVNSMIADMNSTMDRMDSLISLARETDGLSITSRNDLRNGMPRIVNDVSAYYLLGYSSPNQKADGKLRRIKVQVKQKDVTVAARRGYVVPTAASVAAKAAAKAAVPAPPTPPAGVSDALKVLARLGSGPSLLAAGTVADKELKIVAEIAGTALEGGKWREGGAVRITVTGSDGVSAGAAAGRIEPGARSTLLSVTTGESAGPWRVVVSVAGKDGAIDDVIDVRPPGRLMADAVLYRGTGAGRSPLAPAAEFVFHRTERVRAEFALIGLMGLTGSTSEIDRRSARLLDLRGRVVAVEPTLTERADAGGRNVLDVDLNLAPLAGGDYVLEVTAGRGADSEQKFVALRVVR